MELGECLKFNDCEKIKLITTIDRAKYDVDGLIGDICWLCDERVDEFAYILDSLEEAKDYRDVTP